MPRTSRRATARRVTRSSVAVALTALVAALMPVALSTVAAAAPRAARRRPLVPHLAEGEALRQRQSSPREPHVLQGLHPRRGRPRRHPRQRAGRGRARRRAGHPPGADTQRRARRVRDRGVPRGRRAGDARQVPGHPGVRRPPRSVSHAARSASTSARTASTPRCAAPPAWFVDPAYHDDDGPYLSYLGRALPAPERALVEPELDDATADAPGGRRIGEGPDGLVRQRAYRLALLTDPAYADYFARGTTRPTQLAEKTTLINRVNHVYGDDFGVPMLLIDDTDQLNLNTPAEATGANGPCGLTRATRPLDPARRSGCTGGLLTRNRLVIGQLVGAAQLRHRPHRARHRRRRRRLARLVGGDNKAQGCTGLATPDGTSTPSTTSRTRWATSSRPPHLQRHQVNCPAQPQRRHSVEPGSGAR